MVLRESLDDWSTRQLPNHVRLPEERLELGRLVSPALELPRGGCRPA